MQAASKGGPVAVATAESIAVTDTAQDDFEAEARGSKRGESHDESSEGNDDG